MPPWAWIARSMTRQAIDGAMTLMAAISVRAALLPTVSIIQAALRVSRRACSISQRDSAIHSWTTPCWAMGLPKASRSATRRTMAPNARSARPISRMQWWIRPGPRRPWAMRKPSPSSCSRLSAGTRTSSKVISMCPSGSS